MKLEKACKKLLISNPFYGLFMLGLSKRETRSVPTLMVVREGINCGLLVNPDFWNSLSDEHQLGVLTHELMHIAFQHMFMMESFSDKKLFNLAADAEVNSYIENLPEGCVKASLFQLEDKKGTKYYYENIPKNAGEGSGSCNNNGGNEDNGNGEENNDSDSDFDYTSIDDHSNWDKDFKSLSEPEKQLVVNQINGQLKAAAEQVMKSQGTIPGELKDRIDELFKQKPRVFDWKSYFRRMLGNIYDINLRSTRRKESTRFPDAAGLIHKKKVSIMVCVDTSGSVADKELCDFFSEIYHIYKAGANVTIVECDSKIQRIYPYEGKFDGTVSGRGGTSFIPCVEYYNKVRRDYSALIYFTDGEVSIPKNCPRDLVWVITSNGCHKDYPGKVIYIPKEQNLIKCKTN